MLGALFGVAPGLLCGVLLAAAPADAGGPPITYVITHAKLDVIETGKYESGTAVSWEGEGHEHETLAKPDFELPPLPSPLPRSGGGVIAVSDVELDGHETLVDNDGKQDACSGSWGKTDTSGITVKIQPLARGRLRTSWEIPSDLASMRCGVGYSLIRGTPLIEKTVQRGRIGDRNLVLTIKGRKSFSETRSPGKVQQELKYEGQVTLKR